MHLPEAAVGSGKLSRFRGAHGHGVDLRQRKMPVGEQELFPEMLPDPHHDRMRGPAMRTLVIAVFDECHGGVRIAQDMVTGIDRNLQSGHGTSPLELSFH
jgi:hypothetical protein